MNKKVIIGNFKMNLLPNEVVLYIENLKKDIKSNCIRLDLYFCPYIVKKKTRTSDCYLRALYIGANCFWTLISLFEQHEFI